jgi:NAD-dependent dihydropyrimidine dehydrogenase PreA subunit
MNLMHFLKYGIFTLIETIFRFVPLPCRTGLIQIGNPDNRSPVFLTGNYHLTVMRVKNALQGQNAFLLVANSRGINVWCAAAGGHFTHHDVISSLKISGIEGLVAHRKVILPQLAACGIEARAIHQSSGWRVIWGPVYARDIPDFLEKGKIKTDDMREVRFSLSQRLEMAVAWAFPISLVFSPAILFFKSHSIGPAILAIWSLSFFIFISFPLFLPLLRGQILKNDPVRSGLAQLIPSLILLLVSFSGLVLFGLLTANFSLSFLLFWGIVLGAAVFILMVDLPGSTPLLVSGFREEKSFKIVLDRERCRGAAFCRMVCPQNCFDLEARVHKASFARGDKCIRCGACIVQCPFDALAFIDSKGRKILPEHIRKYKTSLFGKRRRAD